MKRKTIYLTLIVICFFLGAVSFTGCTMKKDDEQKKMRLIVDQRGKEIEIPKNVERIVVFHAPIATIIPAIDGTGKKIIGMHPIAMQAIKDGMLGQVYPELKEVSTNLIKSGTFVPNIEEILKLNPDVVFQLCDMGEELIKPMEEVGIPVIGLTGVGAEQKELEEWIKIVGEVLGKKEKALELIKYHHEKMREIEKKVDLIKKKPKVLFVRYMDGVTTVGGKDGGFYQWRFDLTGAENVAKDLPSRIQNISNEQVMEWNPEIIYVENRTNFSNLTSEKILNNELKGWHWAGISAVENGKVYEVPMGGFYWAPQNHEAPLMWKWMANIQHSHINFDIRKDIKDFYLKFYGYRLTEEQIDHILCCDKQGNRNLPCCQKK